MFKTTFTAIALACATVSAAHADQSLFEQGQQDRGSWEQWFNNLSGDFKTGAFFWAGQRSLPHPGSCSQMNGDFYTGCTAAKTKLAVSDALRKTEPDYKAGWNTWTGEAVSAAPTPAPRQSYLTVANPFGSDWYVVNAENHTCDAGSQHASFARSPLAFEKQARKEGEYVSTDIHRDEDGNPSVVSVVLRVDGEKTTIVFFRDRDLCNRMVQKVLGTAAELR